MSMPDKDQAPKYRPVNLDEVDAQNKNVVDAALVGDSKSYRVVSTSQASDAWEEASTAVLGEIQPPYANLHEIPDTEDYALVPSSTKARHSLSIRYRDKEFSLNIKKLRALANITVTKGHRLIIPVALKNLPELGDCMVLHFTKHRMEKITPRT